MPIPSCVVVDFGNVESDWLLPLSSEPEIEPELDRFGEPSVAAAPVELPLFPVPGAPSAIKGIVGSMSLTSCSAVGSG